jgi:hypothetical protein
MSPLVLVSRLDRNDRLWLFADAQGSWQHQYFFIKYLFMTILLIPAPALALALAPTSPSASSLN